jgi:phosphonate transport system substrate-binding protein
MIQLRKKAEEIVLRTLFMAFLFLFLASGCQKKEVVEFPPLYSDKPPLTKKTVYLFGVHPLHNPKRLFEVYQPLIEYINKHLQESELRLEASRNYPSFDKKLFSGHFHFALPNPYQTVESTKHGYKIFGKMGDDENFRGIILIRKDSGIKSVEDLKGKTVSYPAPTALAATMMPQWYLYTHGIDINKDITNSYVGSQESSMMNVYLGKSSAGATWPPPWFAFMKKNPEIAKELVVKWETSSLPNNGLVVRKDVPEALVKKVSNLIFALQTSEEGRKILAAMELSKYEPADDTTYDCVREFLQDFENEVRPIRLNNE